MNILFVNSENPKCGIYQYGESLFSILEKSKNNNFTYGSFSSKDEVLLYASCYDAVVYNWHPATTPFIDHDLVDALSKLKVNQLMIVGHDHYPSCKNKYVTYLDCDCLAKNGIPRPIIEVNTPPAPNELIVGSFGFAFDFKNFDMIPNLVAEQLPNAKLRMHLTPHKDGDSDGRIAEMVAEKCRELNLKFEISQNFLSKEELVNFLANNSLNLFLYPEGRGRGISSSLDFAFSAKRPVALSRSNMFRHVNHEDRFFLDKNTLSEILGYGDAPLKSFLKKWSNENIINFIESKL